jgi:pyruvate kinase
MALSFVQSAADIEQLRKRLKTLGSTAKIIAKIETKAAIDNLEEIIEATDLVMVARGDLAIETSPEAVPMVQRKIISLGLALAKPTIVATQMLASMTEMPEPTRAEVSDVATAVVLGADCVMLSDETANGQYPLEAVQVMKRVTTYTERHNELTVNFPDRPDKTRQSAICGSVIALAQKLPATAIVAETQSGATALQIASRRPSIPLIAVTPDERVAQQLAIVFDVKSYIRPSGPMSATKLTNWLQQNKVMNKGDVIVTASGKHPGVVGTTDTIKVRVL